MATVICLKTPPFLESNELMGGEFSLSFFLLGLHFSCTSLMEDFFNGDGRFSRTPDHHFFLRFLMTVTHLAISGFPAIYIHAGIWTD
jgi:hypothetical protein